MLLNNNDPDEPKGAFSNIDINTRRIKQDACLYNTFATSEPALAPIESIDVSGLWSAPGLGPYKQHDVSSAPA